MAVQRGTKRNERRLDLRRDIL